MPLCVVWRVNLEVFDGCVPVDEEDIVLGVEDSLVDVLTGEGHDRVMVVPEADRKKFGAVTVWSADQIRTPVACCRLVLGNAGSEDVFGVGIGVLGAGPTTPDSCDHRLLSLGFRRGYRQLYG